MLTVRDIDAGYGEGQVLHHVSLAVRSGEAIGLLGRNGAGKTTTLKTIAGLLRTSHGMITFDDNPLHKRKAFEVARLGVAYVPAGRRAFAGLTVGENLLLAERSARRGQLPLRWTTREVKKLFPALEKLETRKSGFLSGGEQQMLKLARALLSQPRLLLLDEPSEGLAPVIVQGLCSTLAALSREEGMAMLLCEQSLPFTLKLASRCYVLEKGVIRMDGPSEQLGSSAQARAYLGV